MTGAMTSRRTLLGDVMLTAACRNERRRDGWLTYLLRGEPGTLDVAVEGSLYGDQNMGRGDFTGVSEDTYVASYPDPADFLSLYQSNYPNWSDGAFDQALTAAMATRDRAARMTRMAECERMLLHSMPFVPLYFDSWVYLERPEVHGLTLNPLGAPSFQYAWFEPNGRRS